MSLATETEEPISKRIKSVDNCNKKPCEEEEKENNRLNVSEDTSELSIEDIQEQTISETLNDIDNEIAINDNDDESFTFPPDGDISDMLDEVQYSGNFPTVTDRYFTGYYKINIQFPGDDICIFIHSNRICMLSVAPSHIVLQGDKHIEKVDFKVSDKLDRSLNKVSGKGKHGAQPLQANSNICTISCSDGQTYFIKCCMTGKLVEVNEMLLKNPQLLREPPHKGGYLAIILPNLKLLENLKQSLLTYEQYISFVK